MPEQRQITGGVAPGTNYPGGYGHLELESAIIRPDGRAATRTVTNRGNNSCEWAVVANDGTIGAFTTMAQFATTTVTGATGPKYFRPLNSGGPTTLGIDLP